MGLSATLGNALSGLKASQSGLDLVANNIANSETPGYVKKSQLNEAQIIGGKTTGVRTGDIRRELDLYLQRQLRTESSGGAYATTRASYLDRLQTIFGTPGSDVSLDAVTSSFASSLDALVTSPDDIGAQDQVLNEAQVLAQTLNSASRDIQGLRAEADLGLQDGVERANEALQVVEQLTKQIIGARGAPDPGLLDARDTAINELASLFDIRVEDLGGGDIRVKTQSGVALYDTTASVLAYDKATVVGPEAAYSSDPSKRTIGTITLTRPSGYSVDLLADGQLRSGEVRALADLRDKSLPQAQTQLDELAANFAQALGTNTIAGTAVAGGVDLTTAGASRGDSLNVSYASGGATRSVTIVNVGDASRLPLSNDQTPDPNDTVIGIDFTSPTAAADLDAALTAAGIAIDATASASGFALTSGAVGLTVGAGASRITATALSDGGLALPLFVDAGAGDTPYSGSLDGGDQRTGFAGRIAVNPALLADPSKLTSYATSPATPSGDTARAEFLRDALGADRTFRGDTGLGGASSPYSGSIRDFASGIVDNQARASAAATRIADGQALVVSSLTDRFSSESGVDVDEEFGRLIQLQTAYTANARVVSAVKEMLDMLLNV